MSIYVSLASMAVKIEHTVSAVAIIMIFCNSVSLMFMPAEVWDLKQSKISQNICFCLLKFTCLHGKLNKN